MALDSGLWERGWAIAGALAARARCDARGERRPRARAWPGRRRSGRVAGGSACRFLRAADRENQLPNADVA